MVVRLPCLAKCSIYPLGTYHTYKPMFSTKIIHKRSSSKEEKVLLISVKIVENGKLLGYYYK
jgi:hypothetical protein